MAHKTEGGDCPLTVNAIIRKRAKDEKISLRKMITRTSEEIDVPEKTIKEWVWPRKKSARKITGTPKAESDKRERKEVQTPAETKIKLSDVQEAIRNDEISDDDLKVVVDTVAEAVEKGEVSPRVLSKSKATFKATAKSYGSPKNKKYSDIVKMVNLFHKFLGKLDAVRGAGAENISKADRDTMDHEFKLMVPRLLRLLDWMDIDLQALVTNYVNLYKEVKHENQDVKRLVGD
jgi:hypothetical protein